MVAEESYISGAVAAHPDRFERRHIGPSEADIQAMLAELGQASLEALSDAAVPAAIRLARPLELPAPLSEAGALARLRSMASANEVFRSLIGLGYHDTVTPPVIQRNILENPGWYTQYTPYQSEISQGRLEGLLNFQTMVCDLTGLDVANASLLDEATACAEAMMLCHRVKQAEGAGRDAFFVSDDCHPQNIDLVRTRARALGVELVVGDWRSFTPDARFCGVLVQYPGCGGAVHDFAGFAAAAHAAGALVVAAADPLALTLLKPPGEWGADVAVGSAQRFGVPMGYGGPHAAYFAVRDAFKRQIPGRLIGVSKDARGRRALRLSLGTREQHIRRDKATSNICTAQALLANMAMAYACYHGPDGLRGIARRVLGLTTLLAEGLRAQGHRVVNDTWFDTLTVELKGVRASDLHKAAAARRINLRPIDATHAGVTLDEVSTEAEVATLLEVFASSGTHKTGPIADLGGGIPGALARTSAFLTHPVFNRHHSETEMLRYLRRLESKDLSLCHSMIPLGSCTMKLNSTAEMFPVSWPEFAKLHPFAPLSQARGYQQLFSELEAWLCEVTGFAGISLQPNAGSQGEYAGLLVIRAYHESRGEPHRNVCLIPTSAHGTNPASAVMAGFKVVPVACDAQGNIDVADLHAKVDAHRGNLACLMVTYPSTHGVFEASIRDIAAAVHDAGGQVYMDGANMNAQVGLTSPGAIGADVCHLNLHKTFCIPHGGGGPGVGPIGVAEHLVPFLPGHPVVNLGGEDPIGAISAAPWGSASICTISWMYIAMMGSAGLTRATQVAILNANYIAQRLESFFPTLYRGSNGLVAHECILDLRSFKHVTAEDVAKRLMDYGFHAPTLSWPVAGTLMVEPTESEPRAELDRFVEAMRSIHEEIREVEEGRADARNNLLKNAPHTADVVCGDAWERPYSRARAAFPVAGLQEFKFWPSVARVDNVYGDRNLVCSCAGMEAYGTTS